MAQLKFSKKLLFLGIVIIALGVTGTIIILNKEKDSKNSSNKNIKDSAAPAPADTNEPKPTDSSYSPKLDKELPEGTISPHTVASDPNQYLGKEIKVRGLIVESSPGQYSITSQKSDEPLGLKLELGSNIDVKPYLNVGYNSKEQPHLADPVTITGKLTNLKPGQPLSFEVKSIN